VPTYPEIDAIGAVLLRGQPRLFCKEGRAADFQHANTFVHLEQVSAHPALFGRADASRARYGREHRLSLLKRIETGVRTVPST